MIYLFFKAVGLVPVGVATFGFLFLVFLISYHTIKRSFAQLENDRKALIEASKNLYLVAQKLITLIGEKGDFLNNYDKILSLAATLHSEKADDKEVVRASVLLKKELDVLPALIGNVAAITANKEVEKILEEMKENERKYEIAYNKYAYNLKYYNDFIDKLPSKWVALLAGYKKQ